MAGDDGFLRGIPKFLRRPEEPVPENPIFMAPQDTVAPPPADIPAVLPAPAEAPARRPGSLSPPQPVRAEPETPKVASLPPRRDAPMAARAPLPSGDFFAEARGSIQELFAAAPQDHADAEDDAAFQVTLPRSVIRQIRILAGRRRQHA